VTAYCSPLSGLTTVRLSTWPRPSLGPLFSQHSLQRDLLLFSRRRESGIERVPSIILPRLDGYTRQNRRGLRLRWGGWSPFFCGVRFLQCGYAEKCKAWTTTDFPAVDHTVGIGRWCAHLHLMRRLPVPRRHRQNTKARHLGLDLATVSGPFFAVQETTFRAHHKSAILSQFVSRLGCFNRHCTGIYF
jgi:hypothetical protein